MADKPDETRNAGKGKKIMPRSVPKKRPSSLWEWQRYVKKETQRIIKGQDTKPRVEPERKIEPAKPTTYKNEEKRTQTNPSFRETAREIREKHEVKAKPEVIIPTDIDDLEDYDDIEDIDDIEQDLDELMSSSEVVYDDTLRNWVKPQVEKRHPAKSVIEKTIIKKDEPKLKAKAQSKIKPDKIETLKLFEEQVEKARRKRNPKRTREHLIENLLDPIISLDEAAVILNVCKTTVRRYTNSGKLECVRTPGNQRRFRLSTVLEFLEEKEGTKGLR